MSFLFSLRRAARLPALSEGTSGIERRICHVNANDQLGRAAASACRDDTPSVLNDIRQPWPNARSDARSNSVLCAYQCLGRGHVGSPAKWSIALSRGKSLPGGSRPAVSKIGRAQIVRPPTTAHVNPGGCGAYFIAVGVEGVQEAKFIGPNPRLHLC